MGLARFEEVIDDPGDLVGRRHHRLLQLTASREIVGYIPFSMWKEQSITVTKSFLDRPDTRLAYLDFGGLGRPLLALHGHFPGTQGLP